MTADDVRALMRKEIERLGGMQSMLAGRAGMSQQYISDLLTGRRDIPTSGALLDYFGIEAKITWQRKR